MKKIGQQVVALLITISFSTGILMAQTQKQLVRLAINCSLYGTTQRYNEFLSEEIEASVQM